MTPQPNFINTDPLLKLINDSKIKTIFIINRDHPKDNGDPNVTKNTLFDYLNRKNFINLNWNNGANILEVDLIKGVEGRINEIFRYIYNDLTANNNFNNRAMNFIRSCEQRKLFNYLHKHYNLFSKINSVEDLIEKGNRKTNELVDKTITLSTAIGFSPIPFVDVPIFLFLIAKMLIDIFKAYGFTIDLNIFREFFEYLRKQPDSNNNNNNNNNNENNNNNNNDNNNDNNNIINNNINDNNDNSNYSNIYNNIDNIYDNNNQIIHFIKKELMTAAALRIGFSTFLGILDFVPGGFILAGIANYFINSPFIKDLGKRVKELAKVRIRDGRENILNVIEGYRGSFEVLANLSNKIEWSRKIQILE